MHCQLDYSAEQSLCCCVDLLLVKGQPEQRVAVESNTEDREEVPVTAEFNLIKPCI